MQRFENEGDVTEFGSLNHSPGKRVLNNLKTICLRFWKVVVVAVIKLRVNNLIDVAMVLAVLKSRWGGYSEVHECDNNKT